MTRYLGTEIIKSSSICLSRNNRPLYGLSGEINKEAETTPFLTTIREAREYIAGEMTIRAEFPLGGGDLMIDYVTIEIGSGGSTVMVEPELRKGLTRRVFRRMLDGSLEWAAYDDWRTHNERARFFGFASRDLPSSMTS